MLFLIVPGGFLDQKYQKNYNSNWKKLLGFRNLQEKLENNICFRMESKITSEVLPTVEIAQLSCDWLKKFVDGRNF